MTFKFATQRLSVKILPSLEAIRGVEGAQERREHVPHERRSRHGTAAATRRAVLRRRIEILEHDGSRHVETVEVPKGHPRDPFSQARLAAKVPRCADHVIGTSATQELIERVMPIEAEPNPRGILGRVGQPMPA